MAFRDYFTGVYHNDQPPDWAMLGGRIVVVDGINPNLVLDGNEKNNRILGAFPPPHDPTVTLLGTGTALDNGKVYQYAHIRKVTLGGLVFRSDYRLAALVTGNGHDARVGYDGKYEYPPAADAEWVVEHLLYRSVGDVPTMLYRVATRPDGAEHSEYTDSTPDANLDQSDYIDISDTADYTDAWVPPGAYIRTWESRLVLAGTAVYDRGLVTAVAVCGSGGSGGSGGADSDVALSVTGQVRECDIGANIRIAGEPVAQTIMAVNVSLNSWTVWPACRYDHNGDTYAMYREFNSIYILNQLGAFNPEAWTSPSNKVTGDELSGDGITGLGVAGGYCYVFYRNHVATLTSSWTSVGDGVYYVRAVPGVPGCVSHKSISDRFGSLIFWYAGEDGVWLLNGTDGKRLSGKLDNLFRNDIEHGLDKYSHGVYNANTEKYHLWVFAKGHTGVRVPQMHLTYDLQSDEWYVGELAAVSSAVVTIEGHRYAVAGLVGGIKLIEGSTGYDAYTFRHVVTAADVATANSIYLPTGGMRTDDVGYAGLPVHVIRRGTDGNITSIARALCMENTWDTLTIFDTWAVPQVGDVLAVGDIRWTLELKNENLMPDWDYEKRPAIQVDVLGLNSAAGVDNPVKVTVTGERTTPGQTASATKSWADTELVKLLPGLVENHGRSVAVKIEGSSAEPVEVYAVDVARSESTRQRNG